MGLTQTQFQRRMQQSNMGEAEFQHFVFMQPPRLINPDPFKLRNPDMTVPYEPLGYLEPRFLSE